MHLHRCRGCFVRLHPLNLLFHASRSGNIPQVHSLLSAETDKGSLSTLSDYINETVVDDDYEEDDEGWNTCLTEALAGGHLEVAGILIQKAGADVNQASGSDGITPLLMGSMNGHSEVVEFLLANGANVNQASNYGETPLFTSSCRGHQEVVKLLLANGARVDQADNFGSTPLSMSSVRGRQVVVKLLLANGADVNQADNNGRTPLIMSSKNGHQEVVKLLKARIATIRRFTILSAIRQVRFRPPTPPPSQLLSLLANRTPDDLVRVILEFLGAESAAMTGHG